MPATHWITGGLRLANAHRVRVASESRKITFFSLKRGSTVSHRYALCFLVQCGGEPLFLFACQTPCLYGMDFHGDDQNVSVKSCHVFFPDLKTSGGVLGQRLIGVLTECEVFSESVRRNLRQTWEGSCWERI